MVGGDHSASPNRPGAERHDTVWNNLWGSLVSPMATFRSLRVRAPVLVVTLLLAASALLESAVIQSKLDVEAVFEAQLAARGISIGAEQMKSMVDNQRRYGMLTSGAAGITTLAVLAAWSSLLWTSARLTRAENVSFRTLWSIVAFASLPLVLGRVLFVAQAARLSEIEPEDLDRLYGSTLAFLAAPDSPAWLQSLCVSADVFAIWSVILYGLGYSVATGVSRRHGLSLALSIWLFWVGSRALVTGFLKA